MTPQTIIAATDKAIAGYGQTITLRHMAVDPATGGITVADEVTCPAAIRKFGPQDLEAGEVMEIRVVVSPTGLAGFVPTRDDRIVIDGDEANIVQIASLEYGGQLCRVNLLCRG
jgi:hypothetical protein